MALNNFERMLQLAGEVFETKNDPDQLDVDEKIIEHLQKIHPANVAEYDDGNGPVAWVLLIPTTLDLMNKFLVNEISEKELYELTPLNSTYEAIYLCSAMVLDEYRRQGIAERLTLDAVNSIRKDHPIKALFVWAFTKEGDAASEKLAHLVSLPLYKKVEAK